MATSTEQGTGKHKHKSAEEPFPHAKNGKGEEQQAKSNGGAKGEQQQSKSNGGGKGEQQSNGPGAKGSETASKSSGSQADGSGDSADLKAREYTGPDGEVHHHTKKYQEQHSGK